MPKIRIGQEYTALRAELDVNRRYIFERPLLIAGGAMAAASGLRSDANVLLVSIPVLLVLLFNLWFTFNRLESSARILAYLQLVHEGPYASQWPGWESALAAYRRFRQSNRRVANLPSKEAIVPSGIGRDRLRFYPPLFLFHIFIALLAVAFPVIVSLGTVSTVQNVVPYWILIPVNTVALTIVLALAWSLRPTRLHDVIEEKAAWMAVFSCMDELLNEEADLIQKETGTMWFESMPTEGKLSQSVELMQGLLDHSSNNYGRHTEWFMKHYEAGVRNLSIIITAEFAVTTLQLTHDKTPSWLGSSLLFFLAVASLFIGISAWQSCRRAFRASLENAAMATKIAWALGLGGKVYGQGIQGDPPFRHDRSLYVPRYINKAHQTTEEFVNFNLSLRRFNTCAWARLTIAGLCFGTTLAGLMMGLYILCK